jgi:hypothetical protein
MDAAHDSQALTATVRGVRVPGHHLTDFDYGRSKRGRLTTSGGRKAMFDMTLRDDRLNITHRPILEAVMLAPADAPLLAEERAGGPRRRPSAARSVQDRRDVSQFDAREIGRAASAPRNHAATVVVASAWLALYVIAVLIS